MIGLSYLHDSGILIWIKHKRECSRSEVARYRLPWKLRVYHLVYEMLYVSLNFHLWEPGNYQHPKLCVEYCCQLNESEVKMPARF